MRHVASGSAYQEEEGPQMWPPGMNFWTRLTMDGLVAMLWHELNDLQFRQNDVAELQARRERLANAFRNATYPAPQGGCVLASIPMSFVTPGGQ